MRRPRSSKRLGRGVRCRGVKLAVSTDAVVYIK